MCLARFQKQYTRKSIFLLERALLTPIYDIVDKINSDILGKAPGDSTEFLSIDKLMDTEQSQSSHKLQLKLGVPLMLMRDSETWPQYH